MEKRLNKKGQDLSIGTLILIVLGIIVLVLLILGFSIGWGNLLERIGIFQGSDSLNDIVTSCNIAASAGSSASYCEDFRQIKIDGKTEYVSCQDGRIQRNLDTELECPREIEFYLDQQCSRLTEKEIEDEVKVNGNICAPPNQGTTGEGTGESGGEGEGTTG